MTNEILHYASPYYDPVKAHEYYMKHRELKGRNSTAGLNDEGKAAASYVKEQLTTERKAKVEANKEDTTNQIDKLREQRSPTSQLIKQRCSVKSISCGPNSVLCHLLTSKRTEPGFRLAFQHCVSKTPLSENV